MESLDNMLSIGKEMKRGPFSVGVKSSGDLIRLGSKEVLSRLKEQYPNVCLAHLYVLQGAIDDVDYDKLPDEVKHDLKRFHDHIKDRQKYMNQFLFSGYRDKSRLEEIFYV